MERTDPPLGPGNCTKCGLYEMRVSKRATEEGQPTTVGGYKGEGEQAGK